LVPKIIVLLLFSHFYLFALRPLMLMRGGITIGRPDTIIDVPFVGETKITAETAPISHSAEIGPSAMPCAYSRTNTSLS